MTPHNTNNIIREANRMIDFCQAFIRKYSGPPQPTEGVGERSCMEMLLFQANEELIRRVHQYGFTPPWFTGWPGMT